MHIYAVKLSLDVFNWVAITTYTENFSSNTINLISTYTMIKNLAEIVLHVTLTIKCMIKHFPDAF